MTLQRKSTISTSPLCRFTFFLLLAGLLAGCQSAYYSAWEQLGVHKRDILVDRVEDAKDAQEDAQKQFSSALEEFSALINFDGGDIEKYYKRLNGEYEDSVAAAKDVSDRIDSIESVADALFKEWRSEIKEYTNASFKRESQAQLNDTLKRYERLRTSLRNAEASMAPVLATMRDNVLMLKHSLNARAIGALREEYQSIKRDIDKLIAQMNASIKEANQFIEATRSS